MTVAAVKLPPKREKLSEDESKKLHAFIGKCVMENVMFPPERIGGSQITVQQLAHDYTIDSLEKIADRYEKEISNITRAQRNRGIEEKRVGRTSVTYRETVESIDLLIKEKLHAGYVAEIADLKESLNEELVRLETPEEKKAKIVQALSALNS